MKKKQQGLTRKRGSGRGGESEIGILLSGSGENVGDLVDEESHTIRSRIQLKWMVFEYEIGRVARSLTGEASDQSSQDLQRLKRATGWRKHREITDEIIDRAGRIRPKRNALTHGKLKCQPTSTTMHIENSSVSQTGPFTPAIAKPVVVEHRGTRIKLEGRELAEIDKECNELLDTVRRFQIAAGLDEMKVSATVTLNSDDPAITFVPGEQVRQVTVERVIKMGEVPKMRE